MVTSYAVLDGKLLLGTQTCPGCGYGRFPGKRVEFPLVVCPGCNGTGRRNGRRCRICTGIDCEPGRVRDLSNAQPVGSCSMCKGSAEIPATWDSSVNFHGWDVPIDIVLLSSDSPPPHERAIVGTLETVLDGGRTWLAYHEDAIATAERMTRYARSLLRYVAAAAITDNDARLASRLVVYITEGAFIITSAMTECRDGGPTHELEVIHAQETSDRL